IRSSEALFAKLADQDVGHILPGGMEGLGYDPAWMMLAYLEPALVRDHFARIADHAIARMRVLRKRGYRWFNGGADMASQTGVLYSPQLLADVVLDSLRRFADACAAVDAVFCYRSDGNLWQVFDLLFGTAGIQAFGEADRDAGMAVGLIHARNPRLRILGNVSSALLAEGTAQQVREETLRMLQEAEGAPFVAGPSNAIVHGTPVENVWAMVEVIQKYRI
nr:uroporphyrinogen decarboxylase family protein [Clostridia bacterium]